MIKLVLLILAVILFVLAALEVSVAGLNLVLWGVVFFAASFIPWRE